MKSLSEYLNEEVLPSEGLTPVVIAPGRFNPPHKGHGMMINELIALGKQLNAKPIVIVVDSGKYGEKNPLTGDARKQVIEKMFNGIEVHVHKNPYEAVEHIGQKHVPVGGVTGADRADSYKKMVGRIFGPDIEGKYEAKVLTRDPDAEGDISRISATKVREAARTSDIGTFRAMTGLEGQEAEDLMKAVKKGMGVE